MTPHPWRWEEIRHLDRTKRAFYSLHKGPYECFAIWNPEAQQFELFDPDHVSEEAIPLSEKHPCFEPTHFRVWE